MVNFYLAEVAKPPPLLFFPLLSSSFFPFSSFSFLPRRQWRMHTLSRAAEYIYYPVIVPLDDRSSSHPTVGRLHSCRSTVGRLHSCRPTVHLLPSCRTTVGRQVPVAQQFGVRMLLLKKKQIVSMFLFFRIKN